MLLKENSLDVLIYSSGPTRNRQYVYECRSCKEKIKVRSNKLETHSGLCFDCALRQRTLRPFEATYRAMVLRQKRYPGQIPITFEEFVEFTKQGQCVYCLDDVIWTSVRSRSNGGGTHNVNLDRLDNSLGYVFGNLVVCCPRCNYFKSNCVSYDAMKRIGPILREFNTGAWFKGGRTGPIKKPVTERQRSAKIHAGTPVNNQTGFRGVHVDRHRSQFIAKAKKLGRIVFLGRHATVELAARAYDAYVLQEHGESAVLNFPSPIPVSIAS